MEYLIRKVKDTELDRAFSLIWRTFLEFVAPDYTEEAVDNFKRNIIDNMDYRTFFTSGKEVMYGAYSKDELLGVVSVRGSDFISCVFVNKAYHRNGIAKALFSQVISDLKKQEVKSIKLNSTPYAVPFYHSIGFKDLGKQQTYQGILFTPMELKL